jgi:hypothetical protein
MERFRDPIQNRLRRGVFRDVEELIMAIGDYIDKHNYNPSLGLDCNSFRTFWKGQACSRNPG